MFGGVKKCAKCEKQVYPVEELKCLDKVWHKGCFKCSVCNMVLNMKNYKGFDKQPYCATHYPQQKHTVITDNPEMQRIKENTKIQSNAKYHEDFVKNKGNYTVLADDPEIRRALENSKIISQAKYHEDFEKNKNKFTAVTDNLETTRAIENQKIVSGAEYKNLNKQRDSITSLSSTSITNDNKRFMPPLQHTMNTVTYKAGEKLIDNNQSSRKIGSIRDYDPTSKEICYSNDEPDNYRSSTTSNNIEYIDSNSNDFKLANNNGSISQTNIEEHLNNNNLTTTVYKAVYDHDANEDDEISFRDGDRFLDCQIVDAGWMVGTHEKSGKYGFFPSNYAEPIDTL